MSLNAIIYNIMKPKVEPTVGMGATMGVGSDSYAMTVTSVNGKRITARMNKCICKDYYAGVWEVLPELEGGEHAFTLRLICMKLLLKHTTT